MNPQKLSRQIRRSMEVLAASGYQCSPVRLGPWHIVAVSSTDFALLYVSEDWPVKPWVQDELRRFPAPANCKRMIHYWPVRVRLPFVHEV